LKSRGINPGYGDLNIWILFTRGPYPGVYKLPSSLILFTSKPRKTAAVIENDPAIAMGWILPIAAATRKGPLHPQNA